MWKPRDPGWENAYTQLQGKMQILSCKGKRRCSAAKENAAAQACEDLTTSIQGRHAAKCPRSCGCGCFPCWASSGELGARDMELAIELAEATSAGGPEKISRGHVHQADENGVASASCSNVTLTLGQALFARKMSSTYPSFDSLKHLASTVPILYA